MSKVKLYLLFFMSFLFSELCSAIEPILVTENTFKLNGEETLYYGFAAGDQIIFDFKEANGKTVKEVEIVEMTSNTKFQDFKTSEINNKKIKVESNGLYAFRFKNPIVAGRICKIKIQRIPDDESKISFDTGWHYENVNDTTFIPYTEDSLTGYVEEKYIETVPELVETKYSTEELYSGQIWIRSKGIIQEDNPRECIYYQIPYVKTPLFERKVKALVVWYGTGEKAESYLAVSENDGTKNIVKGVAEVAGGIVAKNKLGAYAAGAAVDFVFPATGSNNVVHFYITDVNNSKAFKNGEEFQSFYSGKGTGVCVRFTDNMFFEKSTYSLCFRNPNLHDRIRVVANVTAFIEENTYKNVDYERVRQVPQYVTLHKNKYKIKTTKEIRMNGK